MLRIYVLSGARSGHRFEFAKTQIRFGRSPDNDVVFDPNIDVDAAYYHAEIRGENGQYVLYDLGNNSGIYLPLQGMVRTQRYVLQQGDQFQLGTQGPRLQVELFAPPPAYAASNQPSGVQEQTVYAQQSPGQVQPGAPAPNAQPGSVAAQVATGKMGQRTLLAHIDQIVSQQKKGKSTAEIKAFVDQNVKQATNKMRVIVGVSIALVLLSGIVVLVFVLRAPEDPIAIRKELEKLSMNDPKRKELEKRLAMLTGSSENMGRKIYDTNKSALFMLVAHRKNGSYAKGGFCSAFAIKPRVLASNAHCVKAAEDFEEQGAEIYAHLNDSARGGDPKMFKIARYKGHPNYRHSGKQITPDVGLFVLEEGKAPAPVTLAEKSDLKKLGTGDAIYVIGFPGRTMNEESPVATFMASHVGRVTDSNGQRSESYSEGWLIQHEGQTTPGTSGSPIFNGEGRVVAINAGGLLEKNQQAVYKYAMRIDLINDIKIKGMDSSSDE